MLAAVAATVTLVQVPLLGQSSTWTVPRTADGHPDVQGVWSHNSATPMERPAVFEGRAELTDEELATLRQRADEIVNRGGQEQAGEVFGDLLYLLAAGDDNVYEIDPDTGNYNAFWLDDRDFDNHRTSLIVDPPNGRRPPMTEEALTRRRGGGGFGRTDGPEALGLTGRCITYGVPNLMAGYNSFFQIFQSATHVAIFQEMIHDLRVIPLDGRPHLDADIRLWHGDSRARYEGDSLVVETTNFSPPSSKQGASDGVRIIERFTRVGPETLQFEVTYDDPSTWTSKWTVLIPLKRSDQAVYEYACHEGNYAMEGVLGGARAEERAASEGGQ
jgi:hypothetical protein